ncbi:unnamed protein product [Meganyctiphanes norvegica]|uniref:Proline-rich transmembrane protein 3/4 domain-containing protein n=1 Tax=Meganyctiphanes norvegica TaxID=48144 RepID=A0AAV2S2Y7_MEGNR
MGSFHNIILLVLGFSSFLVNAQLGLIASRGSLSRDLLFRETNLGDRQEVPDDGASLLSKLIGEPKPTNYSKRPVSVINMESEIAAIFRAAAYGSSTMDTSSTTTTTTTTTTEGTTTTTVGTTTSDSFENTDMSVISNTLSASPIEHSAIQLENKEQSKLEKYTTVISVEKGNYIMSSNILNEANNQLRNSIREHYDDSRKLVQRPKEVTSATSNIQEQLSTEMRILETYKIRNARYSLGAAWWIHVYISAGLFTLLASAALCLFFRIDSANQLFPRNLYLVLHVLVFVSAIIRCIHMFHDPYGVENRLPFLLLSLLEESSWPLMTAALAVIILTFLQATQIPNILPRCPGAKVILTVITCVHIGFILMAHIITSVEPISALTVAAVVRTLTASWGIAVGCVGIWCVWRFKGPVSFHHSAIVSRAIIMTFMASLAQMVLGVLQLYSLLIPASPTAQPWTWWGRVSLARGLEILIGVCLLLSVVFMTMVRKPGSHNRDSIFTIFASCVIDSNGKTNHQDNIYPVQNDRSIIGGLPLSPEKIGYGDDALIIKQFPVDLNSTLQSGVSYCSISPRGQKYINPTDIQNSMDYHNIYSEKIDGSRSSMLVNDSGFLRFKTDIDCPTNFSSYSLAPTTTTANIEQGFSSNNRAALPNRQSCIYPQSDEYFKQISTSKGLARSNTVHSSKPNYSNKAFQSQEPIPLGSRYSVMSVDSCYSSGSSNAYQTPYPSPYKTYIQHCNNERPGPYSTQKDKRRKISQRTNMECLGTIIEPQFSELNDGSNQIQILNSHDRESVHSSLVTKLISNTYESNGYNYSPLDVTERLPSSQSPNISTVLNTDTSNVTSL